MIILKVSSHSHCRKREKKTFVFSFFFFVMEQKCIDKEKQKSQITKVEQKSTKRNYCFQTSHAFSRKTKGQFTKISTFLFPFFTLKHITFKRFRIRSSCTDVLASENDHVSFNVNGFVARSEEKNSAVFSLLFPPSHIPPPECFQNKAQGKILA